MKTALLVGATGLIGKVCLYQLLENNQYTRVIVLVRKPLAIKHPQLHQVIVNFDALENYKEEIIADDIFCCLGTTIKVAGTQQNFKKVDYEYPLKVATLALQNGATQFLLVSSMGANVQSTVFYSKVKGEVENAIGALGYVSYSIFRPSLLLGNRTQFRLGELIAQAMMKATGFLFIGPLKKYKAIQAATVAKAMVKAALSNSKGKTLYQSDEISKLVD